ncbi:TonB-dependent receptor [Colwellia sp. MSW7]|uniref:TonB-dependent receptor n=1 Tax=Colwellia maritima TaxID=2912588 RepID=A0ABS9X5T9_9GAMM|nr:TonB-dependent receptor [Colwellia maritima]MCI2285598.1 TonB-dependent receptor [Colwellia maritima]
MTLHSYLADGMATEADEEYEQTAIEVRLASPVTDTLSYIVGVYVDDSNLSNIQSVAVNGLVGAQFGHVYHGIPSQLQDSSTMSAFLSTTYNVSDDFRLIFGGRYTSQEKEYKRRNGACIDYLYNLFLGDETDGYTKQGTLPPNATDGSVGEITNCGTFNGYNDDRTSDNFMGEVVAQWDLNSDTVVYAKVGESVKSGGFNFSNTVTDSSKMEYDDETALGYEIGYKSMLLDGNAELNVTIFRTEFDDLQLQSLGNKRRSSASWCYW